jgi:hypothetical protein
VGFDHVVAHCLIPSVRLCAGIVNAGAANRAALAALERSASDT